MAKTSLTFVLLVALLIPTACYTPVNWRQSQVGEVPFEDVWNGFRAIAAADGFDLDEAGSDRGLKVFASRWRTRELPFRRSNRRRVHAAFERESEGGWLVRYYVEQQTVGDIAKALSPSNEDWESAGQDTDTEERIAAKLRMRFVGTVEGVSGPR